MCEGKHVRGQDILWCSCTTFLSEKWHFCRIQFEIYSDKIIDEEDKINTTDEEDCDNM